MGRGKGRTPGWDQVHSALRRIPERSHRAKQPSRDDASVTSLAAPHARQPFAHLPQPACRLLIVGGRRGLRLSQIAEVLPAHPRHLRR